MREISGHAIAAYVIPINDVITFNAVAHVVRETLGRHAKGFSKAWQIPFPN